MLKNNIELDLKTKLIESGTTQTEAAEKVGVSLAYIKPSRVFELVDGFGIFYRNRRR
jgi:hypothetical protein